MINCKLHVVEGDLELVLQENVKNDAADKARHDNQGVVWKHLPDTIFRWLTHDFIHDEGAQENLHQPEEENASKERRLSNFSAVFFMFGLYFLDEVKCSGPRGFRWLKLIVIVDGHWLVVSVVLFFRFLVFERLIITLVQLECSQFF